MLSELNKYLVYNDGKLVRKTTGLLAKEFDNGTGYRQVHVKKKKYLVHRVVYQLHHGKVNGWLDHIDGDKTNNRIENLRLATASQSNCNRRGKKSVKGVCYISERDKYRASIGLSNRFIFLGYYDTPEEAHASYCEAADRLHGEFANYGG